MKTEADPEEQQDDADLGKLLRNGPIGDEAGCERSDQDTRHQVADDRRQFQPLCQVAEHERRRQAAREGHEYAEFVRHRAYDSSNRDRSKVWHAEAAGNRHRAGQRGRDTAPARVEERLVYTTFFDL